MENDTFDVHELYYDPEQNVMTDECGFMVFDVFNIIDPNILYLFKTNKQHMSAWNKYGDLIIMYYGESDREIDLFNWEVRQ